MNVRSLMTIGFLATLTLGALIFPARADVQLGAEVCDPHGPALSQINLKRYLGGDLQSALTTVDRILAADQDDFHASYVKGLILLQLGTNDKATYYKGLRVLTAAAGKLKGERAICGAQANRDWFSIYNTIGSSYFNEGDVANARRFLLSGYENKDKLSKKSRIKLLNNIGLLYFRQSDLANSEKYYAEARSEGSPSAKSTLLTIENIRSQLPGPG